jgi:hypothetical protein
MPVMDVTYMMRTEKKEEISVYQLIQSTWLHTISLYIICIYGLERRNMLLYLWCLIFIDSRICNFPLVEWNDSELGISERKAKAPDKSWVQASPLCV